jgi:D-xylose transport system permease protein
MTSTAAHDPLPPQNPLGGPAPQSPPPTIVNASLASSKPAANGISIRDVTMPLALVAVFGYFALTAPSFLSPRNLSMLATEVSITAVLALGMFLVILPGHIDLSAGSGVGLIGGIAAVLIFVHSWPAPLALLCAMAVAVFIWFVMGSLIVKERVPAFIITLSGLLIFRGLQWLVIQNGTIPVARGGATNVFSLLTTYYVPPSIGLIALGIIFAAMAAGAWNGYRRRRADGIADEGELTFMRVFVTGQLLLLFVVICNQYRGVPLPAVILAVTATAVYVLTRHMPFGRYLYAIGGNEEAALVSGVPVERVTICAFVIMGLIVAVTAFLQTAYQGSSTPTVGDLMELDAVAACVIGGTSLKGGRGTVAGVLMGALIMAALLNGMALLAVSPEYKYIARGVVLGLAVWADVRLGKK